jgi:hypothetical protein
VYGRAGKSAANAGAANAITAAVPSRNFFMMFPVTVVVTSIKQRGLNLVASRQGRPRLFRNRVG